MAVIKSLKNFVNLSSFSGILLILINVSDTNLLSFLNSETNTYLSLSCIKDYFKSIICKYLSFTTSLIA